MGIWADSKLLLAISLGIAFLIAVTIIIVIRMHKYDNDLFDDMDGEEFEQYCVQLLSRMGFRNIEQTKASHDYGIDIMGQKDGISYAIQCKCYSNPVGIKAIQEAYAGKDYYGCMVGVVMTNQVFTKDAIEFADKLNILMWDGDIISKLIVQYGEKYGQ